MLLRMIYDDQLAQAAYLIGCQRTGEAIVFDPERDVDRYTRAARKEGLRLTAAAETHIHADFLSGARELAAAGAKVYLSAEGGPEWSYRWPGKRPDGGSYDHQLLRDGDTFRVGHIEFRAIHTPGHTPEHLCYLVTDKGGGATEPMGLISGDFIFVGDLGRPDLLETAAGQAGTKEDSARRLFASIRRFAELPDYVQVWPAHGAGSACGKALGSVASSSVGFERLTAWWAPHVEASDVAAFEDELLTGQPEAPTYFGRMKRVNRDGPPVLGARGEPRRFGGAELRGRVNRDVVLVDTRSVDEQLAGSVPGALAVPGGGSFATYAAWALDPEVDERPLVLVAADAEQATLLRDRLARVGIDRVIGYLPSFAGLDLVPLAVITPAGVAGLVGAEFLDVRGGAEYGAGHLPGAIHLAAGNALQRAHELPRGGKLVVYCQSGGRSAVVAGVLRNRGFANVVDLVGGYEAWLAHEGGAPVEGVRRS